MSRRIGIFMGIAFCFLAGRPAGALTFDRNVPKATQEQLLSDLQAIEQVRGSTWSALHGSVFGELNGSVYSNWFRSRVLRVGYDPSTAGGAVAYVAPFSDPSRMVLTGNYTRFSHPQIARLMVVFHEARHTETQNYHWPHARCPVPFVDESGEEIKSIWTGLPLAGENACDSRLGGAYATTVILLGNISLYCETCSEKMKMDAEIYGRDQLKRVINRQAADEIKKDLHVSL